jgi:hypothetical protein
MEYSRQGFRGAAVGAIVGATARLIVWVFFGAWTDLDNLVAMICATILAAVTGALIGEAKAILPELAKREDKRVFRWTKLLFIGGAVLFGLFAFGFVTASSVCWDGYIPASELRIVVRDRATGLPVSGAVMRVYFTYGEEPELDDYCIYENAIGQTMVSNEEGEIVCHQVPDLMVGDCSPTIFFTFPMRVYQLPYEVEIAAEGYQPLLFSLEEILPRPALFSPSEYARPCQGFGEVTFSAYDNVYQLVVCEASFALKPERQD